MQSQTSVNLFDKSTFTRYDPYHLRRLSKLDLLFRGNLELRQERGYWKKQHSRAKERIEQLEKENRELKGRIDYLEKKLYGRKTEKGKTSQEKIEQEAGTTPQEPKRSRGQQPGQPGHGRRRYEHLPVVEEGRDLKEKCCKRCGKPYLLFPGTEDSEEIEIEVKTYKRRIKRLRYTPSCDCDKNPGIVTAPISPKLIPKGSLGISVWVWFLLDKFLYQSPTNRTIQSLKGYDLDIPPGTLVGGFKRLSPLLEPILQGIIQKNLEEHHWHCDETRWLVFETTEAKKSFKWYLWLFKSSSAVLYILDPSRSAEVVNNHLGVGKEGIISVDRYSAYKAFVKKKNGKILIAYCWAHVRRDFLTLAIRFVYLKDLAFEWVELIGELYHLNNIRVGRIKNREAFLEADKKLRKAIQEMEERFSDELNQKKLDADYQKVLESLKNHWEGLTVFVDHPWIPMDNNEAERILRNSVVGRKNYYGSGSIWSGHFSAMMFSIFQTLVLWNINPRLWLTEYFTECARRGGKPPPDVSRHLPWSMSKRRKKRLSFQFKRKR